MKKIFKGIGLAMIVTLLALSSSQARTAYVSDILILTFRDGPGTNHTVLKTLKSNTPLNVLEEDKGYYKVELESGEQGWVDKQFVIFDTPNALIVKKLEKEKAELESRLSTLMQSSGEYKEKLDVQKSAADEKLTALENRIRQVEEENKTLVQKLANSREKLASLKAASEDVVATLEAKKTLTAENEKLSQALLKMENESDRLFRTSMIKWFLAGVGVLLMGWLIGLMLSSKRRRKNSLLD